MRQGTSRLLRMLAMLFTLTLVAAACGGGDSTDTADGGDSGGTSGEIFISGSSTVEPISVRVAELFTDVDSGVSVVVDGPGTGDGFQLFCNGETDISDASRQIRDSEAANCEENGITFTEIKVGIDGIGVITNTANDAVDCVTFEQLFNLVGPGATGVSSWSEADASLPDAPLEIFGPGEESGTFDSLVEIVIEDLAEEAGLDATTRPDYNPSGDDNVILNGIQGSDTSLGWVGFAFADSSDVKLLEVDGGDGCVEATPDTIASNEYPIARDLWIYVNNENADANPSLQAFVDFYVTEGIATATGEVGYVPLTADAAAEAAAGWTDR